MNSSSQQHWVSNTLPWFDRVSIGLSTLCAIHCLATPLLLVLIPALGTSIFAGEDFHLYMVIAVVPTSFFALGLGCRRHRRGLVAVLGLTGISALLLALWLEPLGIDHHWESPITILGSLLITVAHVRNYQLCRRLACCDFHTL